MVAQRGQTLGQNPAYRPSDILPLFEGLSVSQICERGTGSFGWAFAVTNPAVLLLLRTRYLSVMFFAGWKEKVWFGLEMIGKQPFEVLNANGSHVAVAGDWTPGCLTCTLLLIGQSKRGPA